MADENNTLNIDVSSADDVTKFMKDLADGLDTIQGKIDNASISDIVDPNQIKKATSALSDYQKRLDGIQDTYQKGLIAATKDAAPGMGQALAAPIRSQMTKDLGDVVDSLKSDMQGIGDVDLVGSSIEDLSKLTDSLDNIQNINYENLQLTETQRQLYESNVAALDDSGSMLEQIFKTSQDAAGTWKDMSDLTADVSSGVSQIVSATESMSGSLSDTEDILGKMNEQSEALLNSTIDFSKSVNKVAEGGLNDIQNEITKISGQISAMPDMPLNSENVDGIATGLNLAGSAVLDITGNLSDMNASLDKTGQQAADINDIMSQIEAEASQNNEIFPGSVEQMSDVADLTDTAAQNLDKVSETISGAADDFTAMLNQAQTMPPMFDEKSIEEAGKTFDKIEESATAVTDAADDLNVSAADYKAIKETFGGLEESVDNTAETFQTIVDNSAALKDTSEALENLNATAAESTAETVDAIGGLKDPATDDMKSLMTSSSAISDNLTRAAEAAAEIDKVLGYSSSDISDAADKAEDIADAFSAAADDSRMLGRNFESSVINPEIQMAPQNQLNSQMGAITAGMNTNISDFYKQQMQVTDALKPFEDTHLVEFNDQMNKVVDSSSDLGDVLQHDVDPYISELSDAQINPDLMSDELVKNLKDGSVSADEFVDKLNDLEKNKAYETINKLEKKVDDYVDEVTTTSISDNLVDLQDPIGYIDESFEGISDSATDISKSLYTGRNSLSGIEKSAVGMRTAFEQTRDAVGKIFRSDTEKIKAEYEYMVNVLGRAQGNMAGIAKSSTETTGGIADAAQDGRTALEKMTDLLENNQDRLQKMLSPKFIQDKIDPSLQGVNDAIEKGMRGKVVDIFAGEIASITGMAPEFSKKVADTLVPSLENVGKGESGKILINQMLSADNIDKKSIEALALKIFQEVGPAMALGSAQTKSQIQDIVEQNVGGITSYIDKQMAAGTSLSELGTKYEKEIRKNMVDKTAEALMGVLDISAEMAQKITDQFLPSAEKFDDMIVEQGGDIDKVIASLKDMGQLTGIAVQNMLKMKSAAGTPTEVVDVDNMKDAQDAIKELRFQQDLDNKSRAEKLIILNKEVSSIKSEINTIDDYIKAQEKSLELAKSDEERVVIRQTIRGLKDQKKAAEDLLKERADQRKESKYELVGLGSIYKAFKSVNKAAVDYYKDAKIFADKGLFGVLAERRARAELTDQQKELLKTYKDGETLSLKQISNSKATVGAINDTIAALEEQNRISREKLSNTDTTSEDRLKAQEIIAANERKIAREQDKLTQSSLEKTRARIHTFFGSGGLVLYDSMRKTVKALKGDEEDNLDLIKYSNVSLKEQQAYLAARNKQIQTDIKDLKERLQLYKEERITAAAAGASKSELANIDNNIKYYEDAINKSNAEIVANQKTKLAVFAGRASRFVTAPIASIFAGAASALGVVQKETEKTATDVNNVANAEQGVVDAQQDSIAAEKERQDVLSDTNEQLDYMRSAMEDIDDPNWGQNLVRSAGDASKFISKLQNGYAEQIGGLFQQMGGLGSGIKKLQGNAGSGSIGRIMEGLGNIDLDSLNNFSQNMSDFQQKAGVAADVMKSLGMNTQQISKIMGVATKAFGVMQIAMAGVEIGAQVYDTIMGKSAADIKKAAQQYDQFIENMNNSIDTVLNASSSDDVKNAIHQQQIELIKQKKAYDIAKDGALKYTGAIDTFRTLFDNSVKNLVTHSKDPVKVYGEFGDKMDEASAAMKAANQQIENLKKIESLAANLAKFKSNVDKINDAFQTVLSTQLDIADLIKKRNDDLQRSEADRDREIRRDKEQKEMDMQFAQEDWANERLTAYTDHLKSVSDMEKDMFKEAKKSQDDFNKEQKKSYDELMKNLGEADKEDRISTLAAVDEYNEQTYESKVSHLKEMAQTEKEYDKERVRRMEDLYDQLAGLEMENDALSYLKAQQDATKEDKRNSDDHKESMRQSEQQFQEESEVNAKAHDEQMEDLKLQNEQRRLELVNGYLEQREESKKQLDESIQELQKSNEERLQEEIKGYAKSEAEAWNRIEVDQDREKLRTDLQKRYAQEDLELQEKQRDADFKSELDQLMYQQKTAADLLEKNGFDRKSIIEQANNAILDSETEFGINRLKVEAAYQTAVMQLNSQTSQWVRDEEEKFAQQSADLESNNAIPTPQGHAKGGELQTNQPSIVGEEGPEFLIPKGPGTVIPNKQTEMLLDLMNGDTPLAKMLKKVFGGGYAAGGRPPSGRMSIAGERGREMYMPDNVSISGTNMMPVGTGASAPSGNVPVRDTFGRTGISTRNSNPALQVYTGHITTPKASTVAGTNQYEAQLSGLTKIEKLSKSTTDKLIETQSQLQQKMKDLQSSTSDYKVSISGFNKTLLDSRRDELQKNFENELKAKAAFAKDQAQQNQAYNKDVLKDNEKAFADLGDVNKKGYKNIFEEGAKAFTDRLQQIVNFGGEEKTQAEKNFDTILDSRSAFSDEELSVVEQFMQDQSDMFSKYYQKSDDDLQKHNENKLTHIKDQGQKEIDQGIETGGKVVDTAKKTGDAQVKAAQDTFDQITNSIQQNVGGQSVVFQNQAEAVDQFYKTLENRSSLYYMSELDSNQRFIDDSENKTSGFIDHQINKNDEYLKNIEDNTDTHQDTEFLNLVTHLSDVNDMYTTFYANYLISLEESQKDQSHSFKLGSENILKIVKQMWTSIDNAVKNGVNSSNGFVKSLEGLIRSLDSMSRTAGEMSVKAAQSAEAAAAAAKKAQSAAGSGGSRGWGGGSTVSGGSKSKASFFAEGGRFGNEPFVAGEKGPEVIVPDGSGYVIPSGGTNNDIFGALDLLNRNIQDSTIIPKNMERGFYQDTRSLPQMMPSSQNNMHLRIDNVSVGADISRSEIEAQFTKLGHAVMTVVGEAVG